MIPTDDIRGPEITQRDMGEDESFASGNVTIFESVVHHVGECLRNEGRNSPFGMVFELLLRMIIAGDLVGVHDRLQFHLTKAYA